LDVFVNGVFDLTAVTYYLSVAAFFLFCRCSRWKRGGITDECEQKAQKEKPPAPVHSQVALLGGSYSLIISAVVLALLIVVNLFVSALPTTLTKYDISSTQLYSITSNTKVVVNALEQDVTIYWVVQSGEEDDVIENLLGKYESLSDHITV